MSNRRIAVIMAGGSGERFWPLSRRNHPKQLLKLAHPDKSLLTQTIERVEPLVGMENILIAAAPHLVEPIRHALPNLNPDQIQAEPHKRNTAGCLVWTVAQILAKDPSARTNTSMAILAADHRVSPDAAFCATVDAALKTAERTGGLGTIGIRPDRPETGYGYIQTTTTGEEKVGDATIHPVEAFREKPDRPTAEAFLASGDYLWNSGTFFWRIDSFLKELQEVAPDLATAVEEISALLSAGDEQGAADRFAELRNISIDYALMEKASKVFVVEALFDWDDVGSWDALSRSFKPDQKKNVALGDSMIIDSENCIVVNEDLGKKICLLGVEGLTVVSTPDAILICRTDRAQDVKKIVEELKLSDPDRL